MSRLAVLTALLVAAAAVLLTTAPTGLVQPGAATGAVEVGPIAFVVLYAWGTCVFIPKPALGAVAGILFGVPAGLVIALAGNAGGGMLGYGAGRLWGSDAQRLVTYRSRRLIALSARLADRPFVSMLWLRLTPGMPFAAVSVAAGASRLPPVPFVLATAIGTLPATATCVALGRAAGSLSSPAVWGPFALALCVVAILWWRATPVGNPMCMRARGLERGLW